MKIKLEVTPATRTMIVAALASYGMPTLAANIAARPEHDPADDGPEVAILSVDRN